jgi:hypothetical protein
MTRRQLIFRVVGGCVLAVVLAGLIALFTPIRMHRGLSPAAWTAKLGEQMPVGSSYESVAAYLDKAGIEHSPLMPKDRKVYAVIRDTCWAAMLQCSTDMEFSFDASGRLTATSVKEGLTGL